MKKTKQTHPTLSPKARDELLGTLKARFESFMVRHKGFNWDAVLARLTTQQEKLWSLSQMESTGGEPDVVGHDPKTGEFLFYDCAPETPKGRRSICYDGAAREARKEHKPKSSAQEMATAMGVEMLSEDDYRRLQKLGTFDAKTSSWVNTPPTMRELGGALFCDYRFGQVFTYHNGVESYYASRGFRACLRV